MVPFVLLESFLCASSDERHHHFFSGVPYIYIASLETGTFTDLKKDPRVTFTFSEAQGGYCDEKGYDPESPRCARVHLVGKVSFFFFYR